MSQASVFVVTPNLNARALVVAELSEDGFDALGIESFAELFAELAGGAKPRVVVLDVALGLNDDKLQAMKTLAPRAEIIVISGVGGPAVTANQVLRRPFTIRDLMSKIKRIAVSS